VPSAAAGVAAARAALERGDGARLLEKLATFSRRRC
jgi:hypothetical protein